MEEHVRGSSPQIHNSLGNFLGDLPEARQDTEHHIGDVEGDMGKKKGGEPQSEREAVCNLMRETPATISGSRTG